VSSHTYFTGSSDYSFGFLGWMNEMKSRKVLISITLRTDNPMKWLNNKGRWQGSFNICYRKTKNPIYHDYYVEKVDAVKLR